MRGPVASGLLSRAGSRSITVEVSSAILDIMKHMSVQIDLMNLADWPEVCLRGRHIDRFRHLRNQSTFVGGMEYRTFASFKVGCARRARAWLGCAESGIERSVL